MCTCVGEHVIPGNVLVRQRGTVFHPGLNVSHSTIELVVSLCSGSCILSALLQVGMGRDHTLYSLVEGHVKFTRVARSQHPAKKGQKGQKPWKKFIEVMKVPKPHLVTLTHFEQPNTQHSST